VHFSLKIGRLIGGNDFNDSPENQLTKFHPLPSEVIFKFTQFIYAQINFNDTQFV